MLQMVCRQLRQADQDLLRRALPEPSPPKEDQPEDPSEQAPSPPPQMQG
jgi:hypothetical protein